MINEGWIIVNIKKEVRIGVKIFKLKKCRRLKNTKNIKKYKKISGVLGLITELKIKRFLNLKQVDYL